MNTSRLEGESQELAFIGFNDTAFFSVNHQLQTPLQALGQFDLTAQFCSNFHPSLQKKSYLALRNNPLLVEKRKLIQRFVLQGFSYNLI